MKVSTLEIMIKVTIYLSNDRDTEIANKPGKVAGNGGHGCGRGSIASGCPASNFALFGIPGVDKHTVFLHNSPALH
jgi:hypothetical protein